MSAARGHFTWYELMSSDPAGSAAFYPPITGWGTQKFDGPMDYTMWVNGAAPMGGLMQLPAEAVAMGAPTHWVGYIDVASVDATAARAIELGAKSYVPPTDIPGAGRFSVLADPTGAVFAIYQSTQTDQPAPPQPTPAGAMSWHELYAGDLETAWTFYTTLFGWQKIDEMASPMGPYRMFAPTPGAPVGGMMTRPAEMPMSAWLFYIHVADLEGAMAAAQAAGGKVLNGPMDVPGGDRIVQMMDKQGGMFALHAAKPS